MRPDVGAVDAALGTVNSQVAYRKEGVANSCVTGTALGRAAAAEQAGSVPLGLLRGYKIRYYFTWNSTDEAQWMGMMVWSWITREGNLGKVGQILGGTVALDVKRNNNASLDCIVVGIHATNVDSIVRIS